MDAAEHNTGEHGLTGTATTTQPTRNAAPRTVTSKLTSHQSDVFSADRSPQSVTARLRRHCQVGELGR